MKQETIEEAAERYVHGGIYLNEPEKQQTEIAFYEGAKWQAKKMYSGEEVLEHLNHLIMMKSSELDKFTDDQEMVTMKWFEKFKKS